VVAKNTEKDTGNRLEKALKKRPVLDIEHAVKLISTSSYI
jgi:hypothetical protein